MNDLVICTSFQEYLPQVRSASVALTVTSPPYDNIRDYSGKWVLDLPLLGRELFRVTMDGGIAALVINDGTKDFAKSLTSFRLVLDWCDNAGWRLFETVIYHRPGRPGAWWNKRFRVDHEYVFLFLKGDRPRVFDKSYLSVPTKHPGAKWHGTQRLTEGTTAIIRKTNEDGTVRVNRHTKCRGTVWGIETSKSEGNKLKSLHPATFPDKLVEDIILCFTLEGDVVLDPMAGSGTTPRMAKKLGRHWIALDVNQEYVTNALQGIAVQERYG